MVQTTHTCKNRNSENITLNGKNKSGSQTYKCNNCGVFRVLFSVKKTENIDLDALNKCFQERNSTRSVARIFGIGHVTVWKYLKKKAQQLANFKTTIAPAQANDTLELDEIFTFYSVKINQIRMGTPSLG